MSDLIALGLAGTVTQGLARVADLLRDVLDRRPLRPILALLFEGDPHCPLPHLGGVLLQLVHDPTRSKVGEPAENPVRFTLAMLPT